MMAKLTRFLPFFILLIYVLAVTIGAFTGGTWAALGLTAGLVAFVITGISDRRLPHPDMPLAIIALALLLVAGCLNLQSSLPALSWKEWVKLLTIFIPLIMLLSPAVIARVGHPKFFYVLTVALVAGSLVLGLELALGGPLLHALKGPDVLIEGYNRGLSYLILMAFPLMAALWRRKKPWLLGLFVLVLLIPSSLTESRTAKLALMLALPVVVLAHYAPILTRRALMLAPFAVLGWPFAAQWLFSHHYDVLARIPDSWHARIEIWDYMSYRIEERPWLGWGLGTSVKLDYLKPDGALYVFTKMPAGHPHNVVTQLWVELGLPGLTLGIAFALLTLRKAAALSEPLAPFALGAWVASFCFCLLAYNFWTDSLLATFALVALAFNLLEKKLSQLRFSVAASEGH